LSCVDRSPLALFPVHFSALLCALGASPLKSVPPRPPYPLASSSGHNAQCQQDTEGRERDECSMSSLICSTLAFAVKFLGHKSTQWLLPDPPSLALSGPEVVCLLHPNASPFFVVSLNPASSSPKTLVEPFLECQLPQADPVQTLAGPSLIFHVSLALLHLKDALGSQSCHFCLLSLCGFGSPWRRLA
jgi:hypothetical protein